MYLFCFFSTKNKIIKAFKHHSVILEKDTINYHTYSKKGNDSIKNLFLYIQGSKATSLYQKKEKVGKTYVGTVIPLNFNLLPDDYLLVVISKNGFPFFNRNGQRVSYSKSIL